MAAPLLGSSGVWEEERAVRCHARAALGYTRRHRMSFANTSERSTAGSTTRVRARARTLTHARSSVFGARIHGT